MKRFRKIFNKKTAAFRFVPVTMAVLCVPVFLQAEEIALPDVTTVISGNEVQVGRDAMPDFSKIIPDEETSVPELIKLPEIEIVEEDALTKPVKNESAKKEKDLFVEGKVGGGYHGFFTGSFDIFRQTEKNPFQLSFSHESSEGYGKKSASDGYFDSETKISGEKTFSIQETAWNFSAFYEKNENGLQSNSSALNDLKQQDTGGKFFITLNPTEKLTLELGSGIDFYSRYGSKKEVSLVQNYEKEAFVLGISPWVNACWSFDSFKLEILGDYFQQNNLKEKEYIAFADLDEQATYRAKLGARFIWSNDVFTLFEEVHAVLGNKLGDNRSIITPFTASLDINAEPDFLGGTFLFNIKGGLDSYQSKYSELEKLYKFSVLGFFPEETTEWYVDSNLTLPLGEKLSVKGSAEYRKTVYENGIWQPDYGTSLASALYGYTMAEREMFKSTAGLSYKAGDYSLSAQWQKQWKDIPVLECENLIEVSLEIQPEDLKYGAVFTAGFEAGKDSDKTPLIGGNGFIRLTPALRLALEADDLIKLVSREKRTYAGEYCSRGGSAALLVKFNF